MQAKPLLCFLLGIGLLFLTGCRTLALPPPPAGVAFEPGQYIREYYAAPDFDPARHRYYLAPFALGQVQGVESAGFAAIFQAELAKAFAANGLALGGAQSECRLEGMVHRVALSSALRFLRGRISGEMQVAGTITQGDRVVFAFRDALRLSSPLAPGPAAPKEAELLVRQLSRAFAQRLLNQLLLYGLAASG